MKITDQMAREFCRAACRLVLDQHEAACDLQMLPFDGGEIVTGQIGDAPLRGKIVDVDPDTSEAVIPLAQANVLVTVEIEGLRRLVGDVPHPAPHEPEEP
ncbi:hypothetical protein [Planctomycetes bacterium TBK1r]|uniref:hypothetical protein n=1 Tax=Stieleria magnilauensis TaxID=2527963 RepID=UPI0011A677B2